MVMAQPASGCVTKVELSISCQELLNKDITSKSDPLCVVFCRDEQTQSWKEIARTEKITNSLNPIFSKKIEIDYFFEEVQKLKFKVYDLDNDSSTLKDDDFLGKMECTLGNIVSKKTMQQALLLKKKKSAGKATIKIVAEEVSGDTRELMLSMKAIKLDNKDFIGKSDPFLEFWKDVGDGTWTLVHRTEVIKNTLNPVWRPIFIPLRRVCGDNLDKKIKVVCSDWDSDGSHDEIGIFYTSVSEIEKSLKPKEFPCINEKKKAKKSSYENSGVIYVVESRIFESFTFLDYILGGLQIHFTVGIDFTASNGNAKSSDSLHYMNFGFHNEYYHALYEVGNVVKDYNSDKLFAAFGFGGEAPPDKKISHEFPLNFNKENPYCLGVDGLLQAYQEAVLKVKLGWPTNISPIINHVARFAYEAKKTQTTPQSYFILLLLTDGVISDMDKTRTAIVNASHLPMSIIIIGVGKADFSAMERLDGDEKILKSPSGEHVARDIVQFVPFKKYKASSRVDLAKAVLAEVPGQVVMYYKQKNMDPGVSPIAPV